MPESTTSSGTTSGTDTAASGGNLPTTTQTGVTPENARANPFNAIALLLQSVRVGLEGTKPGTNAPRWIRIGRIRNFQGESDYVSKAVIPVTDLGLLAGIMRLADLTLMAKDFLFQTDAALALWEVGEEMLLTVTDEKFSTAVAQVIDPEVTSVKNPLQDAQPFIQGIGKIITRVPRPEDLQSIGEELFLLLNITLNGDADFNEGSEEHVNLEKSGKIRLLQMALTTGKISEKELVKSITVRGLGKDKKAEQPISWLGGRRVSKDVAPKKAKGVWGKDKEQEVVYQFSFEEAAETGKDIAEANEILNKLGYPKSEKIDEKAFNQELTERLRLFQQVNHLPETGALDNHTLNRFWHLDFEKRTLERAKPYDEAALKRAKPTDAETPELEKKSKSK